MYSNEIEIIICEYIKIHYLNDSTHKQIIIPYWSTAVSQRSSITYMNSQ
jgi:hypothetical protein